MRYAGGCADLRRDCPLTGLSAALRLAAVVAAVLTGLAAAPGRTEPPPVPTLAGSPQEQAYQAVQAGDLELAEALARQMLAADPRDALAHLVLTIVQLRRGDATGAAAEARLAFRHAERPQQKFHAALLAADIAKSRGQGIQSRLWLGRAAASAPTSGHEAAALRALAEERTRAPVVLSFSFSLAPSSNVNNGSSSPYNVIEGWFPIGVISPDAQALSGWESTLRAGLTYRIRAGDRSQLEAIANLMLYRVALGEEAKAVAPDLSGKDLGDTTLSFGLRQSWLSADGRSRTVIEGEVGRGKSGRGNERDLFGLRATHAREVAPAQVLRFGLDLDVAKPVASLRSETRRLSGSLGYSFTRPNGVTLFGDLTVGDTWAGPGSDRNSQEGTSMAARIGFSGYRPRKGINVSGYLGLSRADFPNFRFLAIPVPGGRQEDAVFGELAVGLSKWSIGGLEPTITMRALKLDSNVTVFSRTDSSLGLDWRIRF